MVSKLDSLSFAIYFLFVIVEYIYRPHLLTNQVDFIPFIDFLEGNIPFRSRMSFVGGLVLLLHCRSESTFGSFAGGQAAPC